MRKIDKDKISKILVVRTERFVGDVLLNIPAIRALKETFNCFVSALISPQAKELFEQRPEIDELIFFDQQAWKKGFRQKLSLLRQIRRKRFDLAVILSPTKRFHLFTFLTGIPLRLGYDRKWGFLLTDKIEDKKFLGQKHEIEYNLDLVRHIGADTKDKSISLKTGAEDRAFVNSLLAEKGIRNNQPLIVLHPYSTVAAKCWPWENFIYLADQIQERLKMKVAIIGSSAEMVFADKMLSMAKFPLLDLTGAFTLKQLAAFLQRCNLLICNDSGPMHIAAAVGLPTIAIFGRNIPGVGPRRWGPYGAGHKVFHKDPGCSPCLDRKCPYSFKCLSSITPEEVLGAVKRQFKSLKV